MKIRIFILLYFFLSFLSCDPYWYNIKIDDNGFETNLNFECGSINVSSKVIADRQFFLILRLKPNYPILINPEKFEVSYEGKAIDSKIFLNDTSLKEIKSIDKDSKVSITINQKVQRGDTLKINIDNFILCEEKPLNIGYINLIFVPRK